VRLARLYSSGQTSRLEAEERDDIAAGVVRNLETEFPSSLEGLHFFLS
jgi:hypothetical protein